MSRKLLLAVVLGCACDPDDACDPGYYADHGFCYVVDASLFPDPIGDASVEDGGEIIQNPNASFGTPCERQSDCGGVAPICGGPDLPICTTINCLDTGDDICPAPWVCVDITKYDPLPGVKSVCVKL